MGRIASIASMLLLLTVAADATATARASPSIRVIPRSAGTGDTVSVVGVEFCAGAACSPVTIRIDGRVAAADVRVAGDGTFNTPLRISEPEGEYQVTATQAGPSGELAASATLIVATIDYVSPERPPHDYTSTTTPPSPTAGRSSSSATPTTAAFPSTQPPTVPPSTAPPTSTPASAMPTTAATGPDSKTPGTTASATDAARTETTRGGAAASPDLRPAAATRHRSERSSSRWPVLMLAVSVVALGLAAWSARRARADGDR